MANSRGYKLPACRTCNELLKLDEEYIRDRFSIAGSHDSARQIFKEGTRPSYTRLRERLKKVTKLDLILRDLVPITVTSKEGLVLGTAEGIKIDSQRVERVSIKIIKGLYYQNIGERIPDSYKFQIYWNPPNWLPDILEKKTNWVGRFGDFFAYKGITTNSDKFVSIWWLSFYRSLGIIVVVLNPELAIELSKE
jgi:hypothetical protein